MVFTHSRFPTLLCQLSKARRHVVERVFSDVNRKQRLEETFNTWALDDSLQQEGDQCSALPSCFGGAQGLQKYCVSLSNTEG